MSEPQTSIYERIKSVVGPRYDGPGRPSYVSTEIANKILASLAQGNYLSTACGAAGINYKTVREWLVRAQNDKAAGLLDSEYIRFAEVLTYAQETAEAALVETIRVNPDWRAQAFLLERGPGRSRWGKQEQVQGNTNVIVLDSSALAGLTDALAVAAQRRLQPPPVVVEGELLPSRDVMSTNQDTISCGGQDSAAQDKTGAG